MQVSYFPGCTLNTTGKALTERTRPRRRVGLELVELPEWNCCGATYPLIIDNMLELRPQPTFWFRRETRAAW